MRGILFLIILFPLLLFGQNELRQIKNPGSKRSKKCKNYYQIYRKLPHEARYSIKVVNGDILFFFPNEKIFNKIFDKKFDGFAIDIISRDQFDCTEDSQLANSWAYKGELLPPLFRKDLKKRMLVDQHQNVIINYGPLPSKYDLQNIECNLIILQKKFHCDYRSFSNIDYNQWDLLEMGLYRDSLPKVELEQFQITKELIFEVPFKKNQTEFNLEDIQPLYDSLKLTLFNIKSIQIEAYTSVEGALSKNEELQNARATSIVKILQTYQQPEIKFHVSALENWAEFYDDIEESKFMYLKNYSKSDIKHELSRLQESEEMKSLLNSHRKAIITMQLERKVSLEENPDEIVKLFGQSVTNQNINEALYIQNFVFQQIKAVKLPEDFLDKFEIPRLSQFSALINNEFVFKYENSNGMINDHIKSFENLLKILPNNPQIKYNLVALKLRATNSSSFANNRKEILVLINSLRQIDKNLLTRLKINYHLLNTEYLNNRKAYRDKNKSLRHVYSNYRNLELTDWERIYLARFLSIYSQFKWAETILKSRANEDDAIPELIDYYFRLTINDYNKINSPEYRELITRSIQRNKRTFCDLFLPTEQGGYSFQLLSNKYLAEMYCQECQ
jgi:hypothetical protein